MKFVKQYIVVFTIIILYTILYLLFPDTISLGLPTIRTNIFALIGLVLPILLIISLTDQWVSQEQLIKTMGKGLNLRGFFIIFLLALLGIGPLYIAFPIAAIMLKRNVNIGYVMFLFGAWAMLNLPLIALEAGYFSITYALILSLIASLVYIGGSYIVKRFIDDEEAELIRNNLTELTKEK